MLLRRRGPAHPADTETPVKPTSGASHSNLLFYDEIPPSYQDNPFILCGYRPVTDSIRASLASWLSLHNSTVHIYSHLLPSILFLVAEGAMYRYLHVRYSNATIIDPICLGLSATYHTLRNYSAKVSNVWLRLDFVGIILLTLGNFVSGIFMVFCCESVLQRIYWAMMITLSLVTAVMPAHPKCQDHRWRTFRVCAFVGTGLSGVAPLTHGVELFGLAQMLKHLGMAYYLGEGLLLILGAIFYTLRIPELWRPGKFDIFGSSHQIFHVLVVLATRENETI
ncbi:hemolysin-III channel protein Izh2 [Aspergillus novoparasiticus]|uniref:Hemolysin-III channel protein Izh2 n=1 Tax=Aspergillus novoparasiticus TaxID=986946 RepID=A0A5N6E821_9EURO|nr:hemolysin-III channel protein Izh2 [Aspergillus novoparasiticus]